MQITDKVEFTTQIQGVLATIEIFYNEVIYKMEGRRLNFYVENPTCAVYGGRSTLMQ